MFQIFEFLNTVKNFKLKKRIIILSIILFCYHINNKSIIKYFRTHTHSLGKVVSGWKISNGKDWNLIGKKSPKEPQMFYPLADPELTFTKGDILAARCTMVIFVIDS